MSTQKSPRAFISHASEDKDRFVTEFARKLRANGIDAWLDKWEMLPGDSLVDKIFEEGLKDTKAVIIVLSSISILKPWVREEINAGFVQRINKASKLIPVIIDECEVPECLKSTVWQRIDNLESYEAELQRIVMAVLGQTDKPALGTLPKYATASILEIGGLTQLDSLIFSECCRIVMNQDHRWISREELLDLAKDFEIPEQELEDSMQILADQMYLKVHSVLGCRIHRIEMTFYGLQHYIESTRTDFASLVEQIGLKIINDQADRGETLFQGFDEPVIVFLTVIHYLENRGFIEMSRYIGGPLAFSIFNVSPKLRRALQQ